MPPSLIKSYIIGYTTEKKCSKWPRQECKSAKKKVKKFTPETECQKKARQLCGPSGCLLKPGKEECFDKTETVVSEVTPEGAILDSKS